ncbi:lipase family protein [Sphingopyxis yananensis]|uniref:lipase family protein n=1 Tax=Sphingopyxis yananensis TaxID=2886687 RepID=UPI001D109695|nr:lipase family protein [Sphingopyxis yananensis]MCC2601976.1 lipase family protein [Sphingopyxis yananensis]
MKASLHIAAMLVLTTAPIAQAAGEVLPAGKAQSGSDVGDGGLSAFYDWRGALPSDAGVIIAEENLPPEYSVTSASKAMRILYTARNGITDQGVVAVSAAVFVPKGNPPAGGWPILAWAHGTTGIADICAPSARPRGDRDSQFLSHWLDNGFLVVASDYQGLGTPGIHPYSNYRAHSYSLLDSARALLGKASYRAANKVILAGQSQGAGAVVAAGGYAPIYTPDLSVRAVIATGAPNLSRDAIETGLASSATDVMVTGAYTMIGYELTRIHPDLSADQIFTPKGRELEARVSDACLPELMSEAVARQLDPSKTFQAGMLKKLWDTDVDLRSFPSMTLGMPLFFGIGAKDTAALPMTTLSLVNDLCGLGNTVEAHIYKDKDHSGVVNAAAPDAIAFAKSVVGAGPMAATCKVPS